MVLGSAVYAGRWQKEAKELAERAKAALGARPVWLFSSGPIGEPPKPEDDPVDVADLMEATKVREHRVFPGKLSGLIRATRMPLMVWGEDTSSSGGETLPPPEPSEPPEGQSLAVQIMTTEHFTLQSARAAATAESSSRSALFLTVLSAALVAVALAAQVASPREVLFLALLALGIVFFLGLVTYLRVLENGIEDYLYVKEMNRIRHFYLEVVPETAPYFVLSQYDDPEGIHWSMGMQVRRWESLLTSAGAVGVINSVVGGVFVALALQGLTRPASWVSIATGALSATLVAMGFVRHGTRRWGRAEEIAPARFARPKKDPDA